MRTGTDIKVLRWASAQLRDVDLGSVAQCMRCDVARECLMRYLGQRELDEIALFLRLLREFKRSADGHKRLRVAADLNGLCLDPESPFFIGAYVSASLQEQFRREMGCSALDSSMLDGAYFEELEGDVYDFLMETHWDDFVQELKAASE